MILLKIIKANATNNNLNIFMHFFMLSKILVFAFFVHLSYLLLDFNKAKNESKALVTPKKIY